jgi:alcohol dehydrogenase class IV
MNRSTYVRETFADSPVEVVSGVGALAAAPEILRELGARRVLLVCGERVVQLEPVRRLIEESEGLICGVFAEVEPDPSDQTVAAGGTRAAELGADAILAIGGGSSLDAGKAIAAEAAEPGWIAGYDRPGRPTVTPEGTLPLVAVPTTAGTASEVTPNSVITFLAHRQKLPLIHPSLYPRVAILDPALLVSAPREARVAAGLDALTHAVESYVSRQGTEETRARALEAVGGIGRHLVAAAGGEPDLAALGGLQRAAMIAGLGFAKSRLGIVHAAALPVSALFGVPHGMANAILLPYGMDFNLPAAPEAFGNLAATLGVYMQREGAKANEAPELVRELAARIGAPQRMRDVGVDRAAIPEMVEAAMKSGNLPLNPRPVTEADMTALFEGAW